MVTKPVLGFRHELQKGAMAQGMGSQDHNSVIRRMAQVARDGFESREMSPAKALRLALGRAVDTLFDLGVTVATVEQLRFPLAEVGLSLNDEGLLVLLDGPGGARGALCLDPQFLAGLIEVQTTGAVRPGVVRPRAATRTDAAMVAPLIDAVLTEFDSQMSRGIEGYVPRGFSFGDMVEDLRGLSLALVAPDFDLLRLTVDLGPGAKTGRLDLVLPVELPPACAATARGASAEGAARLGEVVISAPVVLDAVMARLRLPLRDVWAFKPGDLVPIPRESLGEMQLLGTKGHVVALAKLGQMNGWRALRLTSGGTPEMSDLTEGVAQPDPAPSPVHPKQGAGVDLVPHDGAPQNRVAV